MNSYTNQLEKKMDPRIGELMREGKTVHYAFLNGYDRAPFTGTLGQVEAALGLCNVTYTRSKEESLYTVNVCKKFPSWNERGGEDVAVMATSKSDAIKQVREQMARDCAFTKSDGRVFYKATLA